MHRAAMTEIRLFNWLKAGRGQGFGEHYQPFLQVTRQDHASLGQSHIIPNQFLGRQHHLLSTLERHVLTLNLATPYVGDLREQFPTWPFSHESPLFSLYAYLKIEWAERECGRSEGTVAIAKALRIRHPNFVGMKIPYIFTTDQLVTLRLPGRPPVLVAISVKYRSELRNPKRRRRLFQKLRIERAYWKSLGIPWLLITDRMVNKTVVGNLEWALSGVVQRVHPADITLITRLSAALSEIPWSGRCLDQLAIIAKIMGIAEDRAIRLLKIAIWRRLVPIDLTREINLQKPLPLLPRNANPAALDNWSPLAHVGRAVA